MAFKCPSDPAAQKAQKCSPRVNPIMSAQAAPPFAQFQLHGEDGLPGSGAFDGQLLTLRRPSAAAGRVDDGQGEERRIHERLPPLREVQEVARGRIDGAIDGAPAGAGGAAESRCRRGGGLGREGAWLDRASDGSEESGEAGDAEEPK